MEHRFYIYFFLGALFVSNSCQEKGIEIVPIEVMQVEKARVIVLTDMLNEPDDSQTMVRLLTYANKMDLEGLIAVSSCHQYEGKGDTNEVRNGVHPEEIHKFIDAYEQVLPNLKLHEGGWPESSKLKSIVAGGPPQFGMEGVGDGKSTDGSELIVKTLLSEDPRPLYVCINAGASCLAQALFDLDRQYDSDEFDKIVSKLRVYDDAGQDNAGAWIAQTFPQIHYQRSSNQVFNFMNSKGPATWDTTFYAGQGQHMWANEHIQTNHGPLGALYPTRMKYYYPDRFSHIEGGGTSTWIGHVNYGLYIPEEMTWGGWGGRFSKEKQENILADGQLKHAGLEGTETPYLPFWMYPQVGDRWTDPETGITWNDEGVPIYRWRRAYQSDFEARMDWHIKRYEESNHNPIAVVNGDATDNVLIYQIKSGESISLDASKSKDPDGDKLSYRWYDYPEAGTYGSIGLFEDEVNISFTAIANMKGEEIHLILEVTDQNPIVKLTDYRRVVLKIQ